MKDLPGILLKNRGTFHKIVPFNEAKDKIVAMDFTAENLHLSDSTLADTAAFSSYVFNQLNGAGATYGIGGYDEHRTIYSRSKQFDGANLTEEPRRLHLGIDIWGKANTPIYAPLDGIVHSFKFNNFFGDYGATIILQHILDNHTFYTLYGHLSLKDINELEEGKSIAKGTEFAHFGEAEENGYWPPHLHFQVIKKLNDYKGDYPGVCKFSEREEYLTNCPNPDAIIDMLRLAKPLVPASTT